jgi:hypothetical protein
MSYLLHIIDAAGETKSREVDKTLEAVTTQAVNLIELSNRNIHCVIVQESTTKVVVAAFHAVITAEELDLDEAEEMIKDYGLNET